MVWYEMRWYGMRYGVVGLVEMVWYGMVQGLYGMR